jgi:hypothetical protein
MPWRRIKIYLLIKKVVMKKLRIVALAALIFVPILPAGWFDYNRDQKKLAVYGVGGVVGLYGLRKVTSFDTSAPIRSILRIPFGGMLLAAGAATAYYASDVVDKCDQAHDIMSLKGLNRKPKED